MPAPRYRTRSRKRIFRRTPSGTVKIYYKKERIRRARCAICKRPLSGVPRVTMLRLKGLSKSRKRPNRPYGGNLCPSCLRQKIKEDSRGVG